MLCKKYFIFIAIFISLSFFACGENDTVVKKRPPIISITPHAVDFGEVSLGSSKKFSLTIQNLGDLSLSVTSVVLLNANTGFQIPPFSPSELETGEVKIIELTFTASQAISYSTQLSIVSNDPASPSTLIPLLAKGKKEADQKPEENPPKEDPPDECIDGSCYEELVCEDTGHNPLDVTFFNDYYHFIWAKDRYQMVWVDVDKKNLFFNSFDLKAKFIDTQINVTKHPDTDASKNLVFAPSIAFGWKHSGIAWEQKVNQSREIYYSVIHENKEIITPKALSTVETDNTDMVESRPSVAWSGKVYGAAWLYSADIKSNQMENIYFAAFNEKGEILQSPVSVSAFTTERSVRAPSISTDGNSFAIVFSADNPNDIKLTEVYFVSVDAETFQVSEAKMISPETSREPYFPVIKWGGTGYGITWVENRDPVSDGSDLFFYLVDKNGNSLIDTPKQMTNDSNSSILPTMDFNGTEFGISWIEYVRDNSYPDIGFIKVKPSGDLVSNYQLLDVTGGVTSLYPKMSAMGKNGFGLVWWDNSHEPFSGNYKLYFRQLCE